MTKQHSPPRGRDEFRPPQPLIAGRPYFVASIVPLAAGLGRAHSAARVIARRGSDRRPRSAPLGVDDARACERFAGSPTIELASGARLDATAPLLTWRASELVSSRESEDARPIAAHRSRPRRESRGFRRRPRSTVVASVRTSTSSRTRSASRSARGAGRPARDGARRAADLRRVRAAVRARARQAQLRADARALPERARASARRPASRQTARGISQPDGPRRRRHRARAIVVVRHRGRR